MTIKQLKRINPLNQFIMKKTIITMILLVVSISLSTNANAQFKYQNGRVLIGNASAFGDYPIVVAGGGMYFNHTNSRFFQLDVMSYGAPRIAGHNNEIVFYNTQTSTFNSIQVSNVYNYSDVNAKTNITNLSNGLDIINRLRPVSYNFAGNEARKVVYNQFTGNNAEIGLIAQELEGVLPNLVFTDEEGHKLVNYIALIPVLIDAVQTLQKEVDELKAAR